jgi:small subunit ribosomal protein S6
LRSEKISAVYYFNERPTLQPKLLWKFIHFLKPLCMATNTQNYEMMLIFTPVLAEEDFKTAHKKFSTLIKESGGKIVHENSWGLRALAYPIQKKTTGLYIVFEYEAPTDLNAKLEIQLNRDENVMRHMITHLDKFAVAYNERKRNAPAKSKEVKSESEAGVNTVSAS